MKIKADHRKIELDDEQISLFNKLTKLQQKIALKSLEGYSNSEAYKLARGTAKKPETIAACAAELLVNPKVKKFMESMSKTRVKSTIMSKEEMMERLTVMARGNIYDVTKIRNDVEPDLEDAQSIDELLNTSHVKIKEQHELEEGKEALIKMIKQGKYGLEVGLHDGMAAMKILADINGYNAPVKSEVTSYEKKNLNDLYDDE